MVMFKYCLFHSENYFVGRSTIPLKVVDKNKGGLKFYSCKEMSSAAWAQKRTSSLRWDLSPLLTTWLTAALRDPEQRTQLRLAGLPTHRNWEIINECCFKLKTTITKNRKRGMYQSVNNNHWALENETRRKKNLLK